MRAIQLQLPFAERQTAQRGGAERVDKSEHPGAAAWPFEPAEGGRQAPASNEPQGGVPPRAQLLPKASALAESLSRAAHAAVRLHVTDNRSTMLSFRRGEGRLNVRLHHMFLDAPEGVVHAIADYAVKGSQRASALIDAYVQSHTQKIRASNPRSGAQPLVAKGRFHDLEALYRELNLLLFDNKIEARIGWGRGGGASRKRTIRMGVYDHISRTIRIHPALDSAKVPTFFVRYIVFHEMLHQWLPAKEQAGRKAHHGPEFRARERAYPDYDRAIAWERENIDALLGRR